jgi:signal transduction histidine kinase
LLLNREGMRNEPPLLALSVQDNGSGIQPEFISRVFDPYYTTKPVGQGTGLGLSIVRRLVEQAKGAIHIKSKVGVGTCFTVYLPSKTPSPSTEPVKPAEGPSNIGETQDA